MILSETDIFIVILCLLLICCSCLDGWFINCVLGENNTEEDILE